MQSKEIMDRLRSQSSLETTKMIGLKIKELRKEQKLTQEGLSKLSGVSQCQISKLERGTVHDVGAIILTKLGLSLGLHLRPWWLE